MKANPLVDKSRAFALKMMGVCKEIKHPLINQVLRSGTSIGANIHEAQYGNSKADFIAKLHIALKEANETKYWLILLNKSNYISNEEYKLLEDNCEKIKAMLIKSLNTAKGK